MQKWIFFDLGSTLIDESVAIQTRVERTVARLRGTPQEVSVEEFQAMMEQAAKQNLLPYAVVMERLGDVRLTPFPVHLEFPYPAAKPLLEHLHKRYRLGVIANQSLGTEQRLRNWGLVRYFDVIVASAEEGLAKPDPRIFTLALERAGCMPEEAVMVGDRLDNDIASAKKLGMKTIWVRQGWGGKGVPVSEEMTPDVQVDTLEGLYGDFVNVLTEIQSM